MEQYISFALGAGLVMVIVATVIIVKALLKVNRNKANLRSLEEHMAEISRNMSAEMDSIKDEMNHQNEESRRDCENSIQDIRMDMEAANKEQFDNNDRLYSYVDSRLDKLMDQLEKSKKDSKELLKG
tara:strand:+ start:186 stop:566 length:381 start_codon:yes stop_codon:yes gene_type:complete